MTTRRRARRLLAWLVPVAALGAMALVGPLAPPVAAHATLLETNPADDVVLESVPSTVRLTFDEAVDVAPGALQVLDRDGERVDDGTVDRSGDGLSISTAIDSDKDGTFTVAWRALSEDSHNLAGSFVFHVGERTGAVDIDNGTDSTTEVVAGMARFLALAGTIVLIGVATFGTFAPTCEAEVARRLRRLAIVAGLFGVAAVAVLLVAQAAAASGRSLLDAIEVTPELTVDTRTGVLSLWRIGFLAATVAVLVSPLRRRVRLVAGLGFGAALVVSTSLIGHAWTADDRAVAVLADILHLAAVSVWVGGLVTLAVVLRHIEDPEGTVRRFSTAALVAAVVVAVTGTVSGYQQVRSLDALTNTGYGQLLLLKVAGFGVLIGFGWINRFRLLAVVRRTIEPLLRSIRLEIPVAAVILALTAALISQAPARTTYTEPFTEIQTTDALTVQLDVQPARAGTNDLHLYFFDQDGLTTTPVDAVEVTAATGDIPPRRLDVTPITPTHFSAYGAALTAPGTWTITVTAVQAGTNTTTTFEVPIR